MTLFVDVRPPHYWVRSGRGGRGVRQQGSGGELASLAAIAKREEVWAVVPGESFVTTRVTVPVRSRARLKQALPYALEERLTEDVDAFHFPVLEFRPGQPVLAGIVAREAVSEWRQRFATAGLTLTGMVADYQLLPMHPQANMTIADHGDGRTSIRGRDGTGATIDSDTTTLWWQTIDRATVAAAANSEALARTLMRDGDNVKAWDIGARFGDWLVHRGREDAVPNFLPEVEERDVRRDRIPGLRAAAVLAGIALLGRIGVDGYEYVMLEAESARLSSRIEQLFTATFPEEERVVNARSQFRQKLEQVASGSGAGDDFQRLLVAVARAVGARQTVSEITYREEQLEVVCAVQNFAGLDTLKQRLEASGGVVVELVSSGSLGEQVTGRFRLSARTG